MITDAGPFAQRSDLKWPETLIIRWCPALERIGRMLGTGVAAAERPTRHVVSALAQLLLRSALPLHPTFLVVRPHGQGELSTFHWQRVSGGRHALCIVLGLPG